MRQSTRTANALDVVSCSDKGTGGRVFTHIEPRVL